MLPDGFQEQRSFSIAVQRGHDVSQEGSVCDSVIPSSVGETPIESQHLSHLLPEEGRDESVPSSIIHGTPRELFERSHWEEKCDENTVLPTQQYVYQTPRQYDHPNNMMLGFLRGNTAKPSSACNSTSATIAQHETSLLLSRALPTTATILLLSWHHALEALASATEIRGSSGQVSRALLTSTDVRQPSHSSTENRQPFHDMTNTACNKTNQSNEAAAQSQLLAVIPEWDGIMPDQIIKWLKVLDKEELQKLGIREFYKSYNSWEKMTQDQQNKTVSYLLLCLKNYKVSCLCNHYELFRSICLYNPLLLFPINFFFRSSRGKRHG
jgi:hypothetical protein